MNLNLLEIMGVLMKATVKDITSVKKRLMVEIEADEIDKRVSGAYKSLSEKAKIPGFRAGKVPRKILENYYGPQVLEDLARDLVAETLPTAVEETKAYPISFPAIEKEPLRSGQAFKYSAVIEVKPVFELKDYMGLEVEKEIVRVTDENVDRQCEEIRRANGTLNSVDEDRGLLEEDVAIISYQGFENDDFMDGIKADNFPVKIGSGNFHPDFEKALIGLKKDETKKIKVTFEKTYFHEKLAGRTVDFKVKVVDIKTLELPELDDAFVKNLGVDFETVEELRKKIQEDLEEREAKRVDRDVKARLIRKISDTVDFELPDSLVEAELETAVENVKRNLVRAGSDFEKSGINEQKMREDFRPASELRVKNLLILGEAARLNNISVSEDELSEGFKEMAVGIGQDPQVLRRYYEANQALDSFRERLLEEKTLKYLIDGANIIEVDSDKLALRDHGET